MISAEDAASVIAGVSHIDALPLPFQYFVTYWYQHCPAGGVAPITVLDQPSAPPISFSGIIFRAEPSEAEKLNFRIVRACEAFDFYYKRRIEGCTLDDLYRPDEAARQKQHYADILGGCRADFLKRRRSRVPGREIVRNERIYAPFAADDGTPVFIVGLCKLSYA
jgi:hypothetical protein